jgi:hypothetical protein
MPREPQRAVCEGCQQPRPLFGCQAWAWNPRNQTAYRPYRALCCRCRVQALVVEAEVLLAVIPKVL